MSTMWSFFKNHHTGLILSAFNWRYVYIVIASVGRLLESDTRNRSGVGSINSRYDSAFCFITKPQNVVVGHVQAFVVRPKGKFIEV